MSKKHIGSSFDDFLKEEGIYEETQAKVIEEVVAFIWQWSLVQIQYRPPGFMLVDY